MRKLMTHRNLLVAVVAGILLDALLLVGAFFIVDRDAAPAAPLPTEQRSVVGLEVALAEAEAQLAIYEGARSCLPIVVEMPSFFYGSVMYAETELCGVQMRFAEGAWGPSMEERIRLLERDLTNALSSLEEAGAKIKELEKR